MKDKKKFGQTTNLYSSVDEKAATMMIFAESKEARCISQTYQEDECNGPTNATFDNNYEDERQNHTI